MRKLSIILILAALLLPFAFSCEKADTETTKPGEILDTIDIDLTDVGQMVSIQEYGVLPSNTAAQNKIALQKAIDEASAAGLALYVSPCEDGYKCDGGIVLKKNVTLIGAHGPTGRGTKNKKGDGPTGSLFVITDTENPFITVESATRISGIQFYYPNQPNGASGVIKYKSTICCSSTEDVSGVTISDLTFYGEYLPMDFRAPEGHHCSALRFDNCYGYPLSGQFIMVDRCEGGFTIEHCHINPANMREFGKSFSSGGIDAVMSKGTYAYWIDHSDNVSLFDVFTFGTYGGIYLGPYSYGQLTSFNLDCVNVGVRKYGATDYEANWEISQGSIIANAGFDVKYVHPFIVSGAGHTSILAVNAFSGTNSALTAIGLSQDYIYITGDDVPTVSMVSCSMRNYNASEPITIVNLKAKVKALNCNDKNNSFFNYEYNGGGPGAPDDVPEYFEGDPPEPEEGDPVSGQYTVFDNCDSKKCWYTSGDFTLSVNKGDKTEGVGCICVSGKAKDQILRREGRVCNSRTTLEGGHFMFDMYISDVTAIDFAAESSLELTSAGIYDKEELNWSLKAFNLKNGWNQVDLKLSTANKSGTTDLKNINYLRMYSLGINKSVTIMVDNMRFYEE